MKKIKRGRKISRSKYSRCESIHIEKSIVEATNDNMVIENVDAVVDMKASEVGGLMMTITKDEKYHQEVVGEELQNQGTISHSSNATIE